jgi:hypothetical protein
MSYSLLAKPKRTPLVAAGMAVLLLMYLSGCGSDGSSSPSSSQPPAGESPQSGEQVENPVESENRVESGNSVESENPVESLPQPVQEDPTSPESQYQYDEQYE